MSPDNTEDPNNNNNAYPVQPDPLLTGGAFIDPNPIPNGNGNSSSSQPNTAEKRPRTVDVTDEANRPDWLPTGWAFKEVLRSSGATAGTKDKYFIEPVSGRRFRSKKEVLLYLETGTTPKKRKDAESNADNKQQANSETPKRTPETSKHTPETSKRKKSEAKAKVPVKTFNWDEVPGKVKWQLTDVYEATWRPLINSVDIVPEASKQEWGAAFAYLAMQTGSRGTF